jgi:hypothetical protein
MIEMFHFQNDTGFSYHAQARDRREGNSTYVFFFFFNKQYLIFVLVEIVFLNELDLPGINVFRACKIFYEFQF